MSHFWNFSRIEIQKIIDKEIFTQTGHFLTQPHHDFIRKNSSDHRKKHYSVGSDPGSRWKRR